MSNMFSVKDVIYNFMGHNKKYLLGYLFLAFALPLSKIVLPHVYGKIIDELSKNKKITNSIKYKFYTVFIIWIVVQMLWAAMNWLDSYFIPNLQGYVRIHIVEKVLDIFKEQYHEQEIGSLIAQIIKLPMIVKALMEQIRSYLFPALVIFIVAIIYFFYVNVALGCVSIATLGVFFSFLKIFANTCSPYSLEMNVKYNELHEDISDSLMNLLNIYTAGSTDQEIEKIVIKQKDYIKTYTQSILCSAKFRLLFNTAYLILFFGINGFAFYLFSKKHIHLDQIVSILIISLYLITEMSHITSEADEFYYNINTLDQIQESLDKLKNIYYGNALSVKSVIAPTQAMPTQALSMTTGDISYKNFFVRYGGDQSKDYLIRNLNLVIPTGQKVVITGKIGCGKTTLINALLRLLPYEGDIFVGDTNIKDIDLDTLRKYVTYVPQNPKLFNRTIFENVVYGIDGFNKKQVQSIFDKYNLSEYKLDYVVGKNGSALSGGQRQILYLIRCLIKNSNIIVLDEPTASLDYTTKINMFTILQDLIKDKTVIIITHDPELLQFAERKIVIADGNIVEDVKI